MATKKTYPYTCTFCGGRGTNISVDAINPDGSVVNPRTAPCMVCDGKKVITADMEDQDDGDGRWYVPKVNQPLLDAVARTHWNDAKDLYRWTDGHAHVDVPKLASVVAAENDWRSNPNAAEVAHQIRTGNGKDCMWVQVGRSGKGELVLLSISDVGDVTAKWLQGRPCGEEHLGSWRPVTDLLQARAWSTPRED